jgi:integral membrane sensor domain MASE1
MAMVISGIRCTLAYVVIPFFAPFLGLAPGVGPWLGLAIGVVAIVANVFSIRRFARSRHRLRRPMIVINTAVIVFLLVLVALDLNAVV